MEQDDGDDEEEEEAQGEGEGETAEAETILEELSSGGPEKPPEEEVDVDYFANLNDNDLKRNVFELVVGFNWTEWLDYDRLLTLVQNIDVFESMKRTKKKVAMSEKKKRRDLARLE